MLGAVPAHPTVAGATGQQVSATEQVLRRSVEAREAKERRDEAIRAMRLEGATLRAIAAAAGMSVAGVQRVLDRG